MPEPIGCARRAAGRQRRQAKPRMEVRPRQFEYKLTRERQVVARRWKIRLTRDLTVAVPADEVSKQRSAKRPALATTPRRPLRHRPHPVSCPKTRCIGSRRLLHDPEAGRRARHADQGRPPRLPRRRSRPTSRPVVRCRFIARFRRSLNTHSRKPSKLGSKPQHAASCTIRSATASGLNWRKSTIRVEPNRIGSAPVGAVARERWDKPHAIFAPPQL
jgi:hypothetical protein